MTSEFSAGSPVFHQSLYCSAPMISDFSGVNYFKMSQAWIEPTPHGSEGLRFANEPNSLLLFKATFFNI